MNVVVNEKFSFSKMDTAVVKGIAIIAMIIHHIIPNNSGLPVDYGTGFSVSYNAHFQCGEISLRKHRECIGTDIP